MEGGGTSQLPAAQLRAIFRGPGHRTGNLEVDGEGGDSKPPLPSCGSVQSDCGPPPSLPTPGSIRYLKGPPVLPLPVWTPQPARPHPTEQQPPATPWPREGLQYLEHNYTKKNIPAFLKFKCNRMSCVSPGGPSHRGPHQPSGGLSGGPGWGTFTGPVSELKSPGQGLPGSLHWAVLVGHTGSGWAHPGPTDFAGEKRVRSGSSKAQELQRALCLLTDSLG